MKFIGLSIISIFILTSCSDRGNSRPASTVITPKVPTPNEQENKVNSDAVAAKAQFQKAKDLLNMMGVETEGKDIAIKIEPKTYKETKDLKMALDAYRYAAIDMANVSQSVDEKTSCQMIANSAKLVGENYLPQNIFFDDFEKIGVHEVALKAYGIRFDGAVDREYNNYYGRSERLEEIKKYIARIETFLQVYSDGQSPLNFAARVELEKKLELAKELAATLD
ncbi:MAG: hypothetical protein A4S09_06150 [Proteobacteria bacterium SG_bin7]|nr:MAG: hypothetical protein A4S09_06150 [Proteobacteria bacterium SG_bin7]